MTSGQGLRNAVGLTTTFDGRLAVRCHLHMSPTHYRLLKRTWARASVTWSRVAIGEASESDWISLGVALRTAVGTCGAQCAYGRDSLRCKSKMHRALACWWHLGMFPVQYRYLSTSVLKSLYQVLCNKPVQYRLTHVPGWPQEFKSEESDKSGTEKDTNCTNSIIKHPRTWLLHCTGIMTCMKTGCLPS